MRITGVVTAAQGGMIEARIAGARIGQGVRVQTLRGRIDGIVGEVRGEHVLIAPNAAVEGVAAGDVACADADALAMPLGMALLGRAIDGSGRALDGQRDPCGRLQTVMACPPEPDRRAAITLPLWSGIRAIDGLLTIGRGARIGIFGPPGAGKSSLLRSLAENARADAVVVGLVGERGREAEEWMRNVHTRCTIVCATSDRSAAQRVHAARAAMAQADRLRASGLHVLVILDSLARFAGALRELGLACGQAAGRGGYPASVFANLAGYLEIGGTTTRGSVTLVATVLSDGDERDPVSEAARSLLDGHVQLCATRAGAGKFPAIDVPASTSRTMNAVASGRHLEDASVVRCAAAALQRTADARSLGIMPADPVTLRAMAAEEAIENFIYDGGSASAPASTLTALRAIADALR